MNFRLVLSTTVFSLLVGTSSQAAIITSPSDLNPGEEYRLAFVTSGSIAATSSNIADYNSFVQSAADAVPELLSLGAIWKAIASTSTVAARDNTETNPNVSSGVPIYLLNDTRLVDDNADLWDGSIDELFDVSELGCTCPEDIALVWTGSTEVGILSKFGTLGTSHPVFGVSFESDSRWIAFASSIGFPMTMLQLYGVSSVLTVVPEPSSFLLLGLAGIGGFGVYPVRGRRRSREQADHS